MYDNNQRMALAWRRIPILLLVFCALVLSGCAKKEATPTDESSTIQNPESLLVTLKGRTEFAPAKTVEIAKREVPAKYFTKRIIVKFKKGKEKTSLESISKRAERSGKQSFSLSKFSKPSLLKSAEDWNSRKSLRMLTFNNASDDDNDENTVGEIKRAVKILSEDEDVEYASPEYLRSYYAWDRSNEQWAFQENFMNSSDPRWKDLITEEDLKNNIRIAVVDTGYKPHRDLDDHILKDLGYDFISDEDLASDGNDIGESENSREIDSNPLDMGDDPEGNLSMFHGTFVAGIIAAKNNKDGVNGISSNAQIIHVRVLGKEGLGTDYDIAQGIRYAAGLDNVSGRVLDENQRAHIINLSLGGEGESPIIHEALKDAINNGVTSICAAGNYGAIGRGHIPNYPASYEECIGVGALAPTFPNEDYVVADYSNYKTNVDIVAPGGSDNPEGLFKEVEDELGDTVRVKEGILSTHWSNETQCKGFSANISDYSEDCSDYEYSSGTSFATPHVSATAALILTVNGSLSPLGIASILFRTALSNSSSEKLDDMGWGVLNPIDAVSAAKNLKDKTEAIVLQLKEPSSYRIAKTVKTSSSDDFAFDFGRVKSGSYLIHAGTDFDNDGIYCEKGEKFGTYPESSEGAVFQLAPGKNLDNVSIILRTVEDTTVCPK